MTDTTLPTGTAVEQLQALIREGETRRHLRLGEELEAYLVFALLRHLRDGELLSRVLALEWLQAGDAPREHTETLRDVGDRCLLVTGWFPQQAERRRVTRDYFCTLGRSAYAGAAAHARRAEAALYRQLVEGFHSLVEVLAASRAEATTLPLWSASDTALRPNHGLN